MSFQAMTWAVGIELPAMQKIVLMMLANRTSMETGLCYPSIDLLEKECGMSRRSIFNQIDILEKNGLLTVFRSKGEKGIKNVNKYRLNFNYFSGPVGSAGGALGSAGGALGSAGDALGSAGDALRGSAGDAPEPVTIEPIKEPIKEPTSCPELNRSGQENKKNNDLDFVIALPVVGGTRYFNISKQDVDEWGALYPAVDVLQELRNMLGWLNANREKQKTARGIMRFINSWLARAQDKSRQNLGGNHGGSNAGARQRGPSRESITSMDF